MFKEGTFSSKSIAHINVKQYFIVTHVQSIYQNTNIGKKYRGIFYLFDIFYDIKIHQVEIHQLDMIPP